ncbi:MAG TPA: GNAT family N-acetyltransferase [Gemmatimonadaceae bacterium]|nr:GNAT family N-acetyltransferase [Gemmatimonadaceae bacterium]
MTDAFVIRAATIDDADLIARQRVAMWVDMGVATPDVVTHLHHDCTTAIAGHLKTGAYVGWLAAQADAPGAVVGGAGVHFRHVLPLPVRGHDGITRVEPGRHPTVVNVYTEPTHRRRGVARLLMLRVIDWAVAEGLTTLFLHATPEGRGLYASLGFAPTGDMRLDLRGRPRV